MKAGKFFLNKKNFFSFFLLLEILLFLFIVCGSSSPGNEKRTFEGWGNTPPPSPVKKEKITAEGKNKKEEVRPEGEAQSLLAAYERAADEKEYMGVAADMLEFAKKNKKDHFAPMLAYQAGEAYRFFVKNRELARQAYIFVKKEFPDTRYAVLADSRLLLMASKLPAHEEMVDRLESLEQDWNNEYERYAALPDWKFWEKKAIKREFERKLKEYFSVKNELENYLEDPKIELKAELSGRTRIEESSQVKKRKARSIGKECNVREKPWGTRIGALLPGETVEITGEQKTAEGLWYRIKYGDITGYVFHTGLKLESESQGIERNDDFQTAVVERLAKLLDQTGPYYSPLGEGAADELYLVRLFVRKPPLYSEFREEVESLDYSKLKEYYTGLKRMLYSTPLRKNLERELLAEDYKNAFMKYNNMYLSAWNDPGIYTFDELKDLRVFINIPSRRVRVYRDGQKLLDFPCQPGQRGLTGPADDTRTRTGEFRIEKWHHNFTTKDYPAGWEEDMWKGVFGKWTAELGNGRTVQYIHGTAGPEQQADIPSDRIAGTGSFIRIANRNMKTFHSLCPPGTQVVIFYCLSERNDDGRLIIHNNIYDYKIDGDSGTFIVPAGVLVDYREPADAVR